MNKEEIEDDRNVWRVLSEEEIIGLARALSDTQGGFTVEQLDKAIYEMVDTKIGNILAYLVLEGSIKFISNAEGVLYYKFDRGIPTSQLHLMPGQKLRYTEAGQEQLKRNKDEEVTFVRYLQGGKSCYLASKWLSGRFGKSKFTREYLDFLVPVGFVHEDFPELAEDWSI